MLTIIKYLIVISGMVIFQWFIMKLMREKGDERIKQISQLAASATFVWILIFLGSRSLLLWTNLNSSFLGNGTPAAFPNLLFLFIIFYLICFTYYNVKKT